MDFRGVFAVAGIALVPLIAAASPAGVLSQIQPGLWEFSGPRNAPVRRVCVGETPLLGQIEHQAPRCTRSVVRNDSALAVIDYDCPGAGFGHSEVTVLTPRSIRVQTQGISAGAPFNYSVQGRRVGSCQGH